MKRHLGYDPAYGMDEVFHFDQSNGDFAIETRQDVEPILEANKRLQNDTDGYSPSRELRHIARVPNGVIEAWKNHLGVDIFNKNHADAVRRLLNDPDWRLLRTSPGRY